VRGLVTSDARCLELEALLKNSLFSSSMLLNLINDLLDLAKIENSSFKLDWTYFDLFEVVEKSVETLDIQLGQKRITATHAYRPGDRAYLTRIYGDQHRYLQILLNFMSNAIKFTPNEGTITIQTLLKDKQTVRRKDGKGRAV
jgi:signal transduction histidine kinase